MKYVLIIIVGRRTASRRSVINIIIYCFMCDDGYDRHFISVFNYFMGTHFTHFVKEDGDNDVAVECLVIISRFEVIKCHL